MMFADETPEEFENTERMLKRRGYTEEEIDLMYDYQD